MASWAAMAAMACSPWVTWLSSRVAASRANMASSRPAAARSWR